MTNPPPPDTRLKICPLCKRDITRVEITTSAGVRAFSLCCDAPTEIIDNWDVFEGLPGNLQQTALKKAKAEYAAMDQVDAAMLQRFTAYDKQWHDEHYAELLKGAQRWQ